MMVLPHLVSMYHESQTPVKIKHLQNTKENITVLVHAKKKKKLKEIRWTQGFTINLGEEKFLCIKRQVKGNIFIPSI